MSTDKLPSPVIQVVTQRGDNDCTVSCFAMLLGLTYEESLLAIGEQDPTVLKRGVWRKTLKRAAAKLGYRLRAIRKFNLEEDTGLLSFRDHVEVLREGIVITTHGVIWEVEDFLDYYYRTYADKPTSLWVLEKEDQ